MTDAQERADGTRWRKKPVVVEAVRYLGGGNVEGHVPPDWLFAALKSGTACADDHGGLLMLRTPEGWIAVSQGDWIIKDASGVLYPCKPDLFAETYEPADTPAAPPALPEGYTLETAPGSVARYIVFDGTVCRMVLWPDGHVAINNWVGSYPLADLGAIVAYLQARQKEEGA